MHEEVVPVLRVESAVRAVRWYVGDIDAVSAEFGVAVDERASPAASATWRTRTATGYASRRGGDDGCADVPVTSDRSSS